MYNGRVGEGRKIKSAWMRFVVESPWKSRGHTGDPKSPNEGVNNVRSCETFLLRVNSRL